SRIVHKADRGGAHRIVATSLGGTSTGAFTLNVRPASEAEVKQAVAQLGVQQMFEADTEKRRETVGALAKYLEEKGATIDQADVGLAFTATRILQMKRDTKAAREACVQFAKLFGKSDL